MTWTALEVLRKTMLRDCSRMSVKLTTPQSTAVTTPKDKSAAQMVAR